MMLRPMSSSPHLAMWPMDSRLFMMSPRPLEDTTTTGWLVVLELVLGDEHGIEEFLDLSPI